MTKIHLSIRSSDLMVCCLCRNGTGSGGTEQELEQKKCDYEQAVGGKLYFQHGETSKQLIIRVNPDCKVIDNLRKVVIAERAILN